MKLVILFVYLEDKIITVFCLIFFLQSVLSLRLLLLFIKLLLFISYLCEEKKKRKVLHVAFIIHPFLTLHLLLSYQRVAQLLYLRHQQ